MKKDNGENPWFPGPILVHRRQRTKEFSYLWQAVKRFNKSASGIKILGTDYCDELHAGLMAELNDGVVHLLGVQHAKENISRKLNDYGIPLLQRQVIMDDIFGVSGLINSQSDSVYDEAVDLMKVKWSKIEGKFTRNVSPKSFVSYFEKHKQTIIKTKMCKFVLDQIKQDKPHTQNSSPKWKSIYVNQLATIKLHNLLKYFFFRVQQVGQLMRAHQRFRIYSRMFYIRASTF